MSLVCLRRATTILTLRPALVPFPGAMTRSLSSASSASSSSSSTTPPPPPPPPVGGEVFDRRMKLEQREQAALAADADSFTYLGDEVAARLVDRVADITRSFETCADLGCHTGVIGRLLGQTGQVRHLLQVDASAAMLRRRREDNERAAREHGRTLTSLVGDEDWLPLRAESLDLALSCLSLHWVNDVERYLKAVHQALRPGGALVAAFLGGRSLQELRSAMAVADMERQGAPTPHVSPFIKVSDAGNLLQAAGFLLPTIDTDVITVPYPDMFTLVGHLRSMGATGCSLQRRPGVLSRDVFLAAASAYEALYRDPETGLVPATFEVVYAIGWKADPKSADLQPKRPKIESM